MAEPLSIKETLKLGDKIPPKNWKIEIDTKRKKLLVGKLEDISLKVNARGIGLFNSRYVIKVEYKGQEIFSYDNQDSTKSQRPVEAFLDKTYEKVIRSDRAKKSYLRNKGAEKVREIINS